MKDTSKIVLGALIGLAAGAVLGVLFAPQKGSDFRKTVATKSGDYIVGLKDKYNSVIDSLTSKLDHASNKGIDLSDEVWEEAANPGNTFSHS
ncbi:MAG TPA: YtxH domain-containing protein [Flavobacterium sp.]|jgi:gas vesicle protein